MTQSTGRRSMAQVIAAGKTVKGAANSDFTDAHRRSEHTPANLDAMKGLRRSYQPKDDEGDRLPSETKHIQYTVEDQIARAVKALTGLFDHTATQDYGNTVARADVVVDGQKLVEAAPVPYLLFLEKQLTDLHTFVSKLAMLDPATVWSRDETTGWWRSDEVQTTRTVKIPRNHVLAEATDRHPAQVQVYNEDKVVGTWTLVNFSGAMRPVDVAELVDRVGKLQRAVKEAREAANATRVEEQTPGAAILRYVFGDRVESTSSR